MNEKFDKLSPIAPRTYTINSVPNTHFLPFCRSDSVTWNPHKLLAAPQQCSTLLTRHRNILAEAHSTNATYLFQKDKFYDTRYEVR